MIVTETFYIGERQFTRTYSDSNRYVVRDGVSYSQACDPAQFGRTYTQGEIMEDAPTENAQQDAYATAGRILMGVET